jgi:pimeloyl-ACP methyl ester carboxylesterase
MVHVVDEEHWPGGLTGLAAPPPDPAPLTPVCLHGTMGGAWQFEQAQRRWAERGLASVALNYRGHHDSRPVRRLGRVSVQAYIDDATSVTESTNGPMLVGQSMGGAIALAVAAPNRHRRRRAGVCLPPRPVRWRGAHRVRSSASHRSNTCRPTVCNPRISGHDRRRGHRDPRTRGWLRRGVERPRPRCDHEFSRRGRDALPSRGPGAGARNGRDSASRSAAT